MCCFFSPTDVHTPPLWTSTSLPKISLFLKNKSNQRPKNSYWLWHKRNTKTNLVSTSFINILPVSNIRFHGLSLVDIQIANASGFDAKLTIRTLCAKFASRKHKIAGYFQDWTEILWQYRPFFLIYR